MRSVLVFSRSFFFDSLVGKAGHKDENKKRIKIKRRRSNPKSFQLHKTRPPSKSAAVLRLFVFKRAKGDTMSPSKLLFAFLVLFFVSFSFGGVSVHAQEFEDKDKLMDELDRLKTFTETRIKNKETVLQARKNAWDREEKLDKSLEGLELEDKLEKQFEADLEQVKELGVVGGNNRRMLLLKR
jgi:hypothetical protein